MIQIVIFLLKRGVIVLYLQSSLLYIYYGNLFIGNHCMLQLGFVGLFIILIKEWASQNIYFGLVIDVQLNWLCLIWFITPARPFKMAIFFPRHVSIERRSIDGLQWCMLYICQILKFNLNSMRIVWLSLTMHYLISLLQIWWFHK